MAYSHDDVLDLVNGELLHMYAKHGRQLWGRHEFLGILLEEFEEAKNDIMTDAPSERLTKEVAQIAGVCIRYLETGNRYTDGATV